MNVIVLKVSACTRPKGCRWYYTSFVPLPRSSVPDNIVALGDPNSVARVLHIDPTPETPRASSNYILDQSRLDAVWKKYR